LALPPSGLASVFVEPIKVLAFSAASIAAIASACALVSSACAALSGSV
jgi:hypothetical protein